MTKTYEELQRAHDALEAELHRIQKHPGYRYAVTFEGVSHRHNLDLNQWEPNQPAQDDSDMIRTQ